MRLRSIPLACALALAPGAARAQAPVVLDGAFDEWGATPVAVADPADAPAPYADVRGVKVRADADAVYLMLTLEREMALQGMPGTLVLVLDVDGDPATGWDRHGMPGVDAEIEFSSALGEDGARMGTGLRLMHAEGTASCLGRANEAGVMAAPSHVSRSFEVRIPRGDPMPFGERMTARLVSLDAEGGVADETGVFTADLTPASARPTPPGAGTADPLARAPGTDFRVVSWNVGREGLFQRPDAYGAILRALAPDLLMLDEVAGGHSAGEVEEVLNRAVPGDRRWRVLYGTSGGSQRGVIAVRGPAPVVAAGFAGELAYPDSTLALVPADDAEAQRWLRSRIDAHVPVTGAIVQIGGRRLLAVTVDLESAGTPGSAKDRLRRIEAKVIRDATERALYAEIRGGGRFGGVLVTGDLNLVASRDPLDVLARPAYDGPPLTVALPLRLDGASAATWENAEEPFTPGRLDFVLHHAAFTAVAGGFVFRAADLSPQWRTRHGLTQDASRVTDHLPVVTDLRWVGPAR
jgi:hypothetical protein